MPTLIIHAERSRRRRRTPVRVPPASDPPVRVPPSSDPPASDPPNVGSMGNSPGMVSTRVSPKSSSDRCDGNAGSSIEAANTDAKTSSLASTFCLVRGIGLRSPSSASSNSLKNSAASLGRSFLSLASARTRNLLSSSSRFTSVERARTIFGGGDFITDKRISRESAPSHGEQAGDHLVGDDAERVDVGRAVDRLALDLLGRHVLRRAEAHAGARQRLELQLALELRQLGEAEVEHLDLPRAALAAVTDEDHVLRLEIAVHDVLPVRGGERLRDLADDDVDVRRAARRARAPPRARSAPRRTPWR